MGTVLSRMIAAEGPVLSKPPRITLFESPNLLVTYVPSGAVDRLVVTFASWDETPTKARPGFAEEFLIHRGISAVHVTCSDNSWYQYPEMGTAMEAAARARMSFARCFTYGLSMGGYAAIRFSSAVSADRAITIAPQFAIDPGEPPFDTRWAKDAARIRFIHGDAWTGVQCKVVAIFDNCGIDLRHIVLYRRFVQLLEIGLPYSGHNPARFLLSLGIFQDLIAGLLGEHFDIAEFHRLFQEKRKTSPDYFFNLARAEPHAPRALALLDHALRLDPKRPHILGHRANLLLALGRPAEAEQALQRALAVAPKDGWLHHALALALRRQGRLDSAVQEALLAISLAPGEEEHRELLGRLTAPENAPVTPT